jgi:hypothetical protein
MRIKQWLRNWMLEDDCKANYLERPTMHTGHDPVGEEASQLTFGIIKATNGYIIKASQYKPQQRGPDWQHQLYIVKDDEKIPDVLARIIAINALEQ